MNIDKETVINTLQSWIDSCYTPAQLVVCWVAVHDLLWTRYADDKAARTLKIQIADKRKALRNNKGR